MIPASIEETIEKIDSKFKDRKKICKIFKNCFPNTLITATKKEQDGSTYIITGDIPAMWLRDSTTQVKHYIPLISCDSVLKSMIYGLIKRQIMYINIDPYANAFNETANGQGHIDDITEQNPWAWERKYEIDSLCYPIQLSYLYWRETGDISIFDAQYKKAIKTIIKLWKTEQDHVKNSKYRFQRLNRSKTDTLENKGLGGPVKVTGMTWSGFRPSDDACKFGYLIPSNMFAVVVLRYIEEISRDVYKDYAIEESAKTLKDQIDMGIKNYGIYEHKDYGKIYAYETDGYGNYNLIDDSNCPSLLSIPYIGYAKADDPVYKNTRKFILSCNNPYYYKGKYARGIGSSHTPRRYIWHLSLIMQALTSTSDEEIATIIKILENTDAGTGFMHEGFDANDPNKYTRPWFGWANSLFGELIYKLAILN
ncbi:MAG: glycoside hydrolase family 125 protein [Clostridiales bacterium]|nr:glycoside hydrolase family 125 protein [Clostridiales bacterium]